MMATRILVVDDSAFMRKILTEQISAINGFEVIGTARSGEDALNKMALLRPDIITLDVEMPGMNGLETVKKIRKISDLPVFMLSSLQGKEITIAALESGATDFIEKPQNLRENAAEFQRQLAYHLKSVLQKDEDDSGAKKEFTPANEADILDQAYKAIVIGASTGGPRALMQLVQAIPSTLAIPIFIVQHMPEGFTASFAKRLNDSAQVPVKEASHLEKIQAGTVYVAPGNYHMHIHQDELFLTQTEKRNGVRPAVDHLFESAAPLYKNRLLSVILTGMGKDGTQGMQAVKEAGGYTLAQNKESCVVYGMPGSAVDAGVVDVCVHLNCISDIINKVARTSK